MKTKNRSTHENGGAPASSEPTHEQIAALARQLYLDSGGEEGRDAENWLRAEQILRQKAGWKESSARPRTDRKADNGSRRFEQQF